MNSQTHRDNIMSGRYTEIGVAVVNGILDGQETTLVVQHFGRPAATAPVVPEQAAAEVAPQAQEVAGEKAPEAFPFQTNPEYDPSATQEEVIEITPQDPLPDSELRPAPEANLDSIQIVTTPGTQIPALSSFDLTKSINLALLAVVVIALVFDATLIWHRKTVRRSGKSFIHLVFLLLVGLIIILTNSGNII
jgi:hypothetical protein